MNLLWGHRSFLVLSNVMMGLALSLSLQVPAHADNEGKTTGWQRPCCPAPDSQTITTQGVGEVKVFPDTFSLEANVETDDASLDKARQLNTQKMTALRNALKALNLKSLQLQTTSFNLYPVYRSNKGERLPKLLGYHVSNQLKIKAVGLPPEELAEVSSRVLAITSDHATNTGSLSFYLGNPRPVQLKALELAAQNAQDQARAMATGARAELGSVQMLSSGYSQPMPMNVQAAPRMKMMDMAAGESAPPPPIEVSEATVNAEVSARFELLKLVK